MSQRQRSTVGLALVLIVVGGLLLAVQLVPGWKTWFEANFEWPLVIVFLGVGLLLLGLVIGAPAMAVPACIVAGIGGILYYQNATSDWESWSYLWALIPGFVGVGAILAGLLGEGDVRRALRDGSRSIIASVVLFAIFGSLFGALGFLGDYWPVLLILLGLLIFAQVLFRPRR
ncbi:MAG: hypothetical protein PVI59_05720 [Anaerolineae bacterium]